MGDIGTHKSEMTRAGRVEIHGQFLPAGTGAPTGYKGTLFATVARTGVGLFEVTLADESAIKFAAVEGFRSGLMANAASNLVVDLASEAVATTGKFVLRLTNKATPAAADLAAHANNRIYFSLILRNTAD